MTLPQEQRQEAPVSGGELFDVVAVDLKTGAERFMTHGLTEANAEAFVTMAVMRRGVEVEFFKAVPATGKAA